MRAGKLRRGARRFNNLTPYDGQRHISDFARSMKGWSGFESGEGVYDHVIRYLPRDYPLFARLKEGDQYPEAHSLALVMFGEELSRLASKGVYVGPGTAEYIRLKNSIVPPYSAIKFPNKWRKISRDEPVRTIMAHLSKDGYSHIHYDNNQARTISVREAARLQSFPDGFAFVGAMNQAFAQIGNAVPPLVAKAIAAEIMIALRGTEAVSLGRPSPPSSAAVAFDGGQPESGGGRRGVIASDRYRTNVAAKRYGASDVLTPEQRRAVMARIGSKHTKPEMIIRRVLHECGLRYRLHCKGLPGTPDMVFPKYRAVVFVNGCFWHGHGCSLFRWPTTRAPFWKSKISRNRERDREVLVALRAAGWRTLIVWECALKGRHRMALEDIRNTAESFVRQGHEALAEIVECDSSGSGESCAQSACS